MDTKTETADSVNDYMRDNRPEEGPADSFRLVRGIECHDGFTISVQGHYGAYSRPRENGADYYSHVECGFPSAPVPELAQYKDGDKDNRDSDTESVYGYVPAEVVASLLNAHGGIKGPRQ